MNMPNYYFSQYIYALLKTQLSSFLSGESKIITTKKA